MAIARLRTLARMAAFVAACFSPRPRIR